jgi:hypothetical protein
MATTPFPQQDSQSGSQPLWSVALEDDLRAQQTAGRDRSLPAVTMLCGLLFVPAVLPFLLNASSFLIGTILVCAICIGAYVTGLISVERREALPEAALLAVTIGIFAFAHLSVVYLFRPVALVRALASIPVLILFLAATPIAGEMIFIRTDAALRRAITIVFLMFVAIAMLSLIGLQPPGFHGEKPTFPFTEPSFFAFTISPILIAFCVLQPLIIRWLALGGVALFAVLVSNLTSLAMCLIAILAFARWWQIAIAAGAAVLAWPYVDQDYFLDRLDFNIDSVNLSALVFLQGWQLLDESLRNTMGWGLGIQQLGSGYTNTLASYRINQIMGHDVNLLDGGFLFAKMGSEFGVFGLVIIGTLVAYAGVCVFRLRAVAARRRELPTALVLAYSSVLGSMTEVFLRGSTYFTGTLLLLCTSLFFLRRGRIEV